MFRAILKNLPGNEIQEYLDLYKKENPNFQTPKIEIDGRNGLSYINYYDDPFDPTYDIILLENKYVERYSIKDIMIENENCLRTEGIYYLKGAKLKCYHRYLSGDNYYQTQMFVSIIAPTLLIMVEIYKKFRIGHILPEDDYEATQIKPIKQNCWWNPTTWKIWS